MEWQKWAKRLISRQRHGNSSSWTLHCLLFTCHHPLLSFTARILVKGPEAWNNWRKFFCVRSLTVGTVAMNRNSFFLLSFFAVGVGSALFENENPVQPSGCQWRHNVTDTGSLSYSQIEVLENCLYYYIAQAQPSQFELINDPPWEFPLTIKIDSIVIYQVDLLHKTSSQFNIHGALYLSWHDTRLEWNDTGSYTF